VGGALSGLRQPSPWHRAVFVSVVWCPCAKVCVYVCVCVCVCVCVWCDCHIATLQLPKAKEVMFHQLLQLPREITHTTRCALADRVIR
jgi:hypothetical protein